MFYFRKLKNYLLSIKNLFQEILHTEAAQTLALEKLITEQKIVSERILALNEFHSATSAKIIDTLTVLSTNQSIILEHLLESLGKIYANSSNNTSLILKQLSQNAKSLDHKDQFKSLQYTLTNQNYLFQVYNNKNIYNSISKLLTVRSPEGFSYKRVGSEKDGGYIMLDDFANIEAAFSFGISDNASWDLELASHGIKVYQFDPTITVSPETHTNISFESIGVCGGNDYIISQRIKDLKYDTLENLIKPNFIINKSIIKLDIEGFEYEVFLKSIDYLKNFTQVIIEFHNLIQPAYAALFLIILRDFCKTHQLIHIHPNNWSYSFVVNNFTFSDCMELTFFKRDHHKFVSEPNYYKPTMDRPNNPFINEIFISKI